MESVRQELKDVKTFLQELKLAIKDNDKQAIKNYISCVKVYGYRANREFKKVVNRGGSCG